MPDDSAFRTNLELLLNSNCRENGSNTPDFILSEFMLSCLESFDLAVAARDRWYLNGQQLEPGSTLQIKKLAYEEREAFLRHVTATKQGHTAFLHEERREELLKRGREIHDAQGCRCDPKYIMSCPNMANAVLQAGQEEAAAVLQKAIDKAKEGA